MFDRIAERYDLLNKLMSFGLDRRWRRKLIASLELEPGGHALDVATGTATGICALPPNDGYHTRLEPFDVLFSTSDQLHDSTDAEDAKFTTCVSLVFDRDSAMLTGRKHWLKLEEYSDPIRDLAGAVVSARQDSVTVYDGSILINEVDSSDDGPDDAEFVELYGAGNSSLDGLVLVFFNGSDDLLEVRLPFIQFLFLQR